MPLMPGRLMSIRMTSGRAARANSMPRMPFVARQQAHVGPPRDELLDQLQVGRVVLDVQQGTQRRAVGRLRRPARSWVRLRSSASRGAASAMQFDPEHAAHADGAFHADDAAHQFDQPLAHHQADARAFLAAGLLPEAIEGLEQLRELLRRQSRAGVLDADADALRRARACRSPRRVPPSRLYLIALESRLMRTCFTRVRSALTNTGMSKRGKGQADAALQRLRLDHGPAIAA